ncbi:MAG: carbamoyltransferase HypF [Treponema sp.]|nr:carbamoyltransferase HypF [Treponema sp.]
MVRNQGETCAEITIRGIVQGVGFRPFVYRQALKYGIRGTVRNVSGSVVIMAAGPDIEAFAESIRQNRPPLSFIESITVRPQTGEGDFADFSIIESEEKSASADLRFFPPDLALCENCRAEIFGRAGIYDGGGTNGRAGAADSCRSVNRRRKGYWFNTCTRCGPRFSVLRAFPYDRANTSMDVFPMCPDCSAEYHSPPDIRFHAETVCCHNCGPLLYYKSEAGIFTGEEAFNRALKDLPGGIAIKGIGGYHLCCSPYDSSAVRRLRLLKAREKKPFAIMFRDLDAVAAVCEIDAAETALLTSPARPIVLLKMKAQNTCVFAHAVLNGADGRCGCFLPYTPLQELLLEHFPCLVMTSANISSLPIIKDEEEIFSLIDRVLYHDREIVRSLEDSVAQVIGRKPSLIRRARGYTPLPIFIKNPASIDPITMNQASGSDILAMGGDLKAAFGLVKKNVFTLSQYFGDLENAQIFSIYENSIPDFERLFAVRPRAVVGDAHPRYLSAALASSIAAKLNAPLIKVYHHHAHAASVMAEHGLTRALAAVFDGTGYGEDGNIWGGEFLICEEGNCRRAGHLKNTEILGQDEAARDAVKTAACFLHGLGVPQICDIPQSDALLINAALDHHINTFTTSSMGRLFDAVAAILGVSAANDYEGECAVLLQYKAEEEARTGVKPADMRFIQVIENGMCVFDYRDILLKCAEQREGCALGFHLAICDMIEQMCLQTRDAQTQDGQKLNDIVLSGGVFQNAFLTGLVKSRLNNLGFSVFLNEAVPPNDGGIALGQAFVGIFSS